MKHSFIELPERKLVGITARTDNAAEMNTNTSKIGSTMHRFFTENISAKILHKKYPGKVMAVYTNYESDANGKYTYVIGEEVTSFEGIAEGLETITIPAQRYAKFTSNKGGIPQVIIELWQQIWQMSSANLGGERAYIADFEVYDERSQDPQNAIIDIYIGVKK